MLKCRWQANKWKATDTLTKEEKLIGRNVSNDTICMISQYEPITCQNTSKLDYRARHLTRSWLADTGLLSLSRHPDRIERHVCDRSSSSAVTNVQETHPLFAQWIFRRRCTATRNLIFHLHERNFIKVNSKSRFCTVQNGRARRLI